MKIDPMVATLALIVLSAVVLMSTGGGLLIQKGSADSKQKTDAGLGTLFTGLGLSIAAIWVYWNFFKF